MAQEQGALVAGPTLEQGTEWLVLLGREVPRWGPAHEGPAKSLGCSAPLVQLLGRSAPPQSGEDGEVEKALCTGSWRANGNHQS